MIQISTIEELQAIGNNPYFPLDGEYELTQDIDARDTVNWNNGAGFKPIGSIKKPFRGKFDGKRHKITGLYINRLNTSYIGLFGYIGSGIEVKNIGLDNVLVYGYYYVGALVGSNFGRVSGCYSTGTVSGNTCVGGLLGENWGTVTGCYSTSLVTGVYYIGGLLGENSFGRVSGCYSTGAVSGNTRVGGLVGLNESSGTVTNCYAISTVSSSGNDLGGLVGKNYGTVSNCYSAGLVLGTSYVSGLVGSNSGTVSSSYWDIETSGRSNSAGGTDKTTAQMKQQATFIDWDFTNVWGIDEGVSYPYLLWQYKGE